MIKQGIVSHGYQLNGELDLWHDWKARGLDKAFSRGELAVEPNPLNGTCEGNEGLRFVTPFVAARAAPIGASFRTQGQAVVQTATGPTLRPGACRRTRSGR